MHHDVGAGGRTGQAVGIKQIAGGRRGIQPAEDSRVCGGARQAGDRVSPSDHLPHHQPAQHAGCPRHEDAHPLPPSKILSEGEKAAAECNLWPCGGVLWT